MRVDYTYLIVGGGMAADAAAHGIRERDATGTIGIVSEEPTPPFPRPALSKTLWTDPAATVESADLDTEARTGAEVQLRSRVVSMERQAKTVTTETGDVFGYEKLLIATGGHPRHVPGLGEARNVLYFRSLLDYRHLRSLTDTHPRVVVVGGSFLGTELAAALVQAGCEVELLFSETTLGGNVFPPVAAATFQQLFVDAGVVLRPGSRVVQGSTDDVTVQLQLQDGPDVTADVVVVCLGIAPVSGFAEQAGLAVADDGGVVVDDRLATSDPSVFAAGDVAQYPDRILGRRRVEHVDNATTMGAVAGRVMAGSDEVYDHTPMFYSDVFTAGYQAVGTVDASLETVVDDGPEGRVVVYYLRAGAVVGVLLWNVGDGLDEARQVIAAGTRSPSGSIAVV